MFSRSEGYARLGAMVLWLARWSQNMQTTENEYSKYCLPLQANCLTFEIVPSMLLKSKARVAVEVALRSPSQSNSGRQSSSRDREDASEEHCTFP